MIEFVQSAFSYIGPFFILLGLLIFVHEAGHFLVAKWCGVRVEVFSLGFGKKIISFKRGDTTYCVSLIPLGGYVKMYGDDPTMDVPEDQKAWAFLHKPVSQRIAIVLAGPLMNLIFAFFIFIAVSMIGERVPSTTVGDIAETSPAYDAGFRSGDKIMSINGSETETWSQVRRTIGESANKELTFSIERNDKGTQTTETVKVTPQWGQNRDVLSMKDQVGQIEGLSTLSAASIVGVMGPDSPAGKAGIKPLDIITAINGEEVRYWRQIEPILLKFADQSQVTLKIENYKDDPKEREKREVTLLLEGTSMPLIEGTILSTLGIESPELYLLKVKDGTPAAKAGLTSGDRLVALDGKVLNNWEDVINSVKSYKAEDKKIVFNINRAGEEKTLEIVPELTSIMNAQHQQEDRFTVGILPSILQVSAAPVVMRTSNPVTAFTRGAEKTWDWTKKITVSVVKIVTGSVSSKNIGGIITIGKVAGDSFQAGIEFFLNMMAIISINLFLINLLPVPILDGGHLVFFTIEALRGAPISMRKMEVAQQVGLILLLTLMAYSLFNDIDNLLNRF